MKLTRFTIKTWIARLLIKLGLRRAAPKVVASPEEVMQDLHKHQKDAIEHLASVRASNLAISRSYAGSASNHELHARNTRAMAANHNDDAMRADATIVMIQSSLLDASEVVRSTSHASCSDSGSSYSYSSDSCSSSSSDSSSSSSSD